MQAEVKPLVARLDGVDKYLEQIDIRLDRMDDRFDKMDERMDRVEVKLDKVADDVGVLVQVVSRLAEDRERG
ncbi:hypothetical protein [Cupriavidus pauculus]|uniref:t-SNARE coiled-coil homology domain-containing protein n=1 Tax=Cupriavidus pauculus TaxID=82633 RepID=A0A2N5C7W7_9BURK|nr:hypothetical protein [Cupriavidus pauculus]PLP98302.1 hypothetical protein CYJ10_22635 [Cupriavidus pauculus]